MINAYPNLYHPLTLEYAPSMKQFQTALQFTKFWILLPLHLVSSTNKQHVSVKMSHILYHIQCRIKTVAFHVGDGVIGLRDCIKDMLIVSFVVLFCLRGRAYFINYFGRGYIKLLDIL